MKMLLGALGYDAAIEGYTGTNWSIQVAKRALAIGLDDGLVGTFVGNKALTREEACLYAFNTMCADMVQYDQKSTISVGDLTITQNSEAKVITNDKNVTAIWNEDTTDTLQFAEKFFSDLGVTRTTDAFGRPATAWTNDGDPVGTYADEADFVYVNEFDADVVEDLEDAKYVLNAGETKVWYNGVNATGSFTYASFIYDDEAINGFTIELFNSDKDKNIEAIVVTQEYFAQVGKFTAANEKKDTEAKVVVKIIEQGTTEEVTVIDDPDADDDIYDVIAASYEKDDYIAVIAKGGWELTANDQKGAEFILVVNPVEAVEGKVQKVTAGDKTFQTTVKMDGVTYTLNNECVGVKGVVKATDEGTLYLDAQGLVIGYVAKADAVTDKAIAVTDVFNTLEDGKIVTKVEGVLSTGEKATFTLKTGTVNEYQIYTYTEDETIGDVYTFAQNEWAAPADGKTYSFSGAVNKTDKSLFNKGNVYFAEDLKVIYVDDANDELTIKEGMQDIAAGTKYATIAKDANNNLFVTAIFVPTAPATGVATADSLIYVAKQTGTVSIEVEEDKYDTFYTYEAYVNGEEVEEFYSKTNNAAGKFYKNVVDEDTGAYILTDKVFEGDEDLGVVLDTTVTKFVANVVNGTYGVASAVVNDLSTDFDGIEVGCKVSVIYDKETNDALYVFVMNAPELT
jgi:hypothetical protein